MRGILRILFPLALAVATASAGPMTAADSLRAQVSDLAAQGRLDEASQRVEAGSSSLPPSWDEMFRGKLALDGDSAAGGFTAVAEDTSSPNMQGEAVFRMGQYHYAAGRYNLAIPRFRAYLERWPAGEWAEASDYWMAFACLQFSRQKPGREAYLDTALAYLDRLEARTRASGYYWPLARAAQARIYLRRGDTAQALLALKDARRKAPREELPGAFLLSFQADPHGEWEDSLRWNYPLSPETQSLSQPAIPARPDPQPLAVAPAPAAAVAKPVPEAAYTLQLGVFAQRENAERMQKQLAGKKLPARIEPMPGRALFRVLYGGYATAEAADRDGKTLLKPLGYAFRVTPR